LLFKNVRVFFIGSDDFPPDAKVAAAGPLNDALACGLEIAESFPLEEIAAAHQRLERLGGRGRIVLVF